MKIILTQLPFRFYNLGLTKQISNIPLAAGFLKAMASKEGLNRNADIEILDPLVSDVASDCMLIQKLINKNPDVIGFSLYLWNVARSLYVIKEVKKILPKTIIVVGGPEITKEFNYISDQGVDFSVTGEGEIPFVQLVNHFLYENPPLESISNLIFRKADQIIYNPHKNIIDDINNIPSPYLSGCLDPKPYKRYWLETMRWCAYRCKYCLYCHRSQIKNPFYSLKRIEEELNYAKNSGLKYIDIHDSAFNLNPKFREICYIIQKVNKNNSIHLNALLQAELLNEEDVDLLVKSNISYAEIGLQSVNPETLRKIGRNTDLDRWLKGISLLKKKGMGIMIDVMIGLPGDNLKSILKTIEFLKKNKLDYCSTSASLSVGPATAIYKEAKELGIVRFQSQAPHFILETDQMSFSDIRKARNLTTIHLKRKLPKNSIFSPYLDKLPSLHTYCRAGYAYKLGEGFGKKTNLEHPRNVPITKIIIDLDSNSQDSGYWKKLGKRLSNRIANNLIIWFRLPDSSNGYQKSIAELLTYLSKPNPYNIWNIVLEGCAPLSPEEEKYIKQSIFYYPNNLDYREVYIKRRIGKEEFYRFSTKFFYILPPLGNIDSNEKEPKIEENRKIFRSLFINASADLL
ncbi:B12-binding domain-containing radical SAM protein, partial [Candidatus Omnitrophota bacterium]